MHKTMLLTAMLACGGATWGQEAQPPERPTGEPAAGTAIVHQADDAVMVWVPSGYFIMGMDRDEAIAHALTLGYKDYHKIAAEEWFPKRRVYVEGFFVDKYEVTNERWRRFVAAAAYKSAEKRRKAPVEKKADEFSLYPVVRITWQEAQLYANWARKRLPTEKQWEKAARGTDGRLYPWGNEPPTPDLGAFPGIKPNMARMVGSFPKGASPYGCQDMSGNVYEWTCEWMEPYPNNPEAERMLSYTGHRNACLRGGSFYHAMHALGAAKRFGFKPDETYYHVGFRTVWEPPAGYFKSLGFAAAKAKVKARQTQIAKLRAKGDTVPPTYF